MWFNFKLCILVHVSIGNAVKRDLRFIVKVDMGMGIVVIPRLPQ